MVKIQWYPGHMEKARREMGERLKSVDMLIELRDARIPEASVNPIIKQMAQGKPRLIVLTKIDMADPEQTQKWVEYLCNGENSCIAVDLMKDARCAKKIIREAILLMEDKRKKQLARGIRPRPIRAMACGIPNVGKSTMINRIHGKNTLKAANKPGVTRSLTWLHADENLDLLDTPGVLWPKFDDEKTGSLLAALGSINDDILDRKMVAMDTIHYIQDLYPDLLEEIYESGQVNPNGMLKAIAKKRNLVKADGILDTKRAAELFLTELRHGKLGRLTLERVNENQEDMSE
ncbi:MAG: ribosome biogenesis GTPase YlqF [Erysipelotrichaceae bacterium]|nr:ribosome biogenesis GTPase YlqF [Erysipelotrichaceae bacterium]MDY6035644.1 ribosome biogenesis GTPase YlqF [Bulleidia sp.]